MQADALALVNDAIQRIPELRGADPSSVVRLAGLTNLNFRITVSAGTFVIRIPGHGTSEYIDRRAEEVAARSAAAAGVNCEVIFFDSSDGLALTRFVDDAMTMSPESFEDLGAVVRAGQVLRRLHDRATQFSTDFSLFPVIDDFRRILVERNAVMPVGYDESAELVSATYDALEGQQVQLVPSHCDPLCANFLDTGERMYLIDFEYAGNNDPMWDLGDLSVEGEFDEEQDRTLLSAYFDGDPGAPAVGRMVAYKAMCDVLWALWGQVQFLNGNPVEDFAAYANHRMQRALTLMRSADYPDHLAAITSI